MSHNVMNIGNNNTLTILREVEFGLYLDGGDPHEGGWGEILLPRRQVPEHVSVGDSIDVFIYFDSEDRPIATRETPLAKVGEFAFLKVVDVNGAGAFLDWGLSKDILCPYAEQSKAMREGAFYLVHVYQDEESERITASSKLGRYLDKVEKKYSVGEQQHGIIMAQTDIGYKVILNHTHTGMLYHNEVFTKLNIGQKITLFISNIREDGKLDLRLPAPNKNNLSELEENIMNRLSNNNGIVNLGDKTSPEEIYTVLSVSKKNFKRAISRLYKKRYITIQDHSISLVNQEE